MTTVQTNGPAESVFSWCDKYLAGFTMKISPYPKYPRNSIFNYNLYSSVQSLSHVQLFATLWTAARQASLSFIISQSLLKLMSIELMMLSNHPILCRLGGNRHVEWCVVSRLYLSHALSQKATEGCAQSKREVKAIKRRKRILRTSIVIQRLKVYYAPKAGGPASIPDPACLN